MQPDLEFLIVFFIYSLRTVAALFWGFFLLFFRERSRQNLPLSLLFIIIGLLYLRNGFFNFPPLDTVDAFNPVSYFILIFIAPFTIFYAWFSLSEKHGIKSYLLQFWPFVLALCLWAGLRLSGEPRIPFSSSIIDLLNHAGVYPLHVAFFLTLILVFFAQVITYFTTALVRLIRIWKVYKVNDLSMRPLKILILMDFLFLLYPLLGIVYLSFNNNIYFGTVFNFTIPVIITTFALLNINLILPVKTDVDFIHDPLKKISPPVFSSVVDVEDDPEDRYLMEKIRMLLEFNELYRLPHLLLDDLANELHSNRSYVSACINKYFGCNFKQLIIRYRIDAAKELLFNSSQDIQTIIDSVGFNSRASFYKAFRESVSEGLSPIEWRKENQKTRDVNSGNMKVYFKNQEPRAKKSFEF